MRDWRNGPLSAVTAEGRKHRRELCRSRSAEVPPCAPLGALALCPGTAVDALGWDYPCWCPLTRGCLSCANCGQRIDWPQRKQRRP
jgi:hypothetical protein